MIVIDGADGTGKTTLARTLSKALNIPLRHMSRPSDDFDHIAGYMSLIGPHIQDRFHLGSVVYGRMLGSPGGSASAAQMRLVQRYLRWQGVITVVLHCQRDKLRKRLRSDAKEELYDEATILAANDGFRALLSCSNSGVPWHDISIDVTDRWPDIDDEPIQQLIERWKDTWGR